MNSSQDVLRQRFARAVRRHPHSAVVRSITFGPTYCTAGRVLVAVLDSASPVAQRHQMMADLEAPRGAQELVERLAHEVGEWSVGLDPDSPRRGIRVYGKARHRVMSIGKATSVTVIGIKWVEDSEDPLVSFYEPGMNSRPPTDQYGGEIERLIRHHLAEGDGRLLVREIGTLRASVDARLRPTTLGAVAPELLSIASVVGADRDSLALLLGRDAASTVGRIAFGTSRSGEAFTTVYFRRDREVVGSGT